MQDEHEGEAHAINLHIHHFTSLPMLMMSDEAKTDRKLQCSEDRQEVTMQPHTLDDNY